MTSRLLVPFVIVLVAGSFLAACAGFQGEPTGARFEIEHRFRRPIDANELGIQVRDERESGALSPEQIGKLSHFLAKLIRESGSIGGVFDLTRNEAEMGGLSMVLDVSVTDFKAATEQEQAQGIRSRLVGQLALTDRQGNNRGLAKLEAAGINLRLTERSEPPDTVRLFAERIIELLQ